MKKPAVVIALIILLAVLFVISSPVRAIKAGAVLHGCRIGEVLQAGFEKTEGRPFVSAWRADTDLLDRLTGSGHRTWRVYSVLFIHIAVWAGNA